MTICHPSSVAINDRITTLTLSPITGSNLVVGWENLLNYNTIVVNVIGSDSPNYSNPPLEYNLYLSGPDDQFCAFVNAYKKVYCIKELENPYIFTKFFIILKGYVKVNVFEFSTSGTPATVLNNNFYQIQSPIPVLTPPDLTDIPFEIIYNAGNTSAC